MEADAAVRKIVRKIRKTIRININVNPSKLQ
jgi:hypothetical protein